MKHSSGPYTVENNALIHNGCVIEHPSILVDIDDTDNTYTLVKHGSEQFVQSSYTSMVNKLRAAKNEIFDAMIADLKVYTFEISDKLTADDIATAFNAATHCTGNVVLKSLMNNDTTAFYDKIKELSKLGY